VPVDSIVVWIALDDGVSSEAGGSFQPWKVDWMADQMSVVVSSDGTGNYVCAWRKVD
jgi:hypothetical protein